MNNKNFISMESSCFFEVQETPTELKINKRNYNEYKDIAKKLTINYIKRNKNLHFNNLVTPNYTHIEIREISRLKETLAKTRVLPYQDHLLINSTPLSQNINFMLGCRDTEENYVFVNKLYKKLGEKGICMINLSEYVIVLNPKDNFIEQKKVLNDLVDTIYEIDERELTPRYMDSEVYGLYHKIRPTILISTENLGYDITEEEYKKLPLQKKSIDSELIVIAAKNLGFKVKFLFKESDC